MLVSPDTNLLVTGGCGFMGSAFIRYLLQDPKLFTGNIVNLDLLTYAANPQSLSAIDSARRYQFIHGDVCDAPLVEKLIQKYDIGAIIHFAAHTHVDRSIDDPAPFFNTNIRGTYSLLEVIRAYPEIHFHHISTDEVYGSLGDDQCFYEHSPFRPNSPYAASKAAADLLIRSYAQTYKISVTVSHSCNNFGPFQFPEKLIPVVITNAIQKKPIPIYGKGHNVRSWIFVEDHARAIWHILQKGKKGESYNIGGTEINNLSLIDQLLQSLSAETGAKIDRYLELKKFVQDRPGHDFRYALSTTKLTQQTGFTPVVSFEEGLGKTVRWYLKHSKKTTTQ